MAGTIERRLQFATNVAFLLVCLVGIAVGLRILLTPTRAVQAGTGSVPQPLYEVGEALPLPGVDYSAAEHTLVLVIRKGCRFCDESMPFYKSIGSDPELARQVRIVVVAPEEEGEIRAELARHEVKADAVVSTPLTQLKVRGTPTAIIVDRRGIVRRVDTGRLRESAQQELISSLRTSQ